METHSQSHNVIIHNESRITLFYAVYKKSIIFFAILFIFLPIAFVGNNNAYLCFYTFLVTSACWIFNVLHPAIVSLIPLALSTIINIFGFEIMNFMNIRNILLDCFGILIFLVAIENSRINKRIALKILYFFGCTHYRLCFVLFYTTMLLSTCVSNTLACGFMMPIVKAVIVELEKMGILELYETIVKGENEDHVKIRTKRPTDFTVFYFLGIAYSSSIGGIVTMGGTQTNQVFKVYSESLFPLGPKIEFPQFMLLTLPAMLVLETMLYLWMNFYFLGLFRIHNYSALQCGSTEEEAQYVKTLLKIEYRKLGNINAKEVIVCLMAILCGILQITTSALFCKHRSYDHSHIQVSAPSILCSFILFICPTNLHFLRFCKKQNDSTDPLPTSPSKPCLSWNLLRSEIHWRVLLVTGSSYAMFEALKQSRMTDEFEKFLQFFGSWSPAALALVVVVFCKVLTEFASNTCVAHCMLDHIARVSVASRVNPHYVMLAATLASCLPFHTIVGTPANAMVASYFNISHRRLMYAGIGPSIFSILVIWFTVAVWSKAIWSEINIFPDWANNNVTIHYNVN